jgi:hypothetical protein
MKGYLMQLKEHLKQPMQMMLMRSGTGEHEYLSSWEVDQLYEERF